MAGSQSSPFVLGSPDFTFTCNAVGGFTNTASAIATTNAATNITISFKNNNVRKFGCQSFVTASGGMPADELVAVTANTNLGNSFVINYTVI